MEPISLIDIKDEDHRPAPVRVPGESMRFDRPGGRSGQGAIRWFLTDANRANTFTTTSIGRWGTSKKPTQERMAAYIKILVDEESRSATRRERLGEGTG